MPTPEEFSMHLAFRRLACIGIALIASLIANHCIGTVTSKGMPAKRVGGDNYVVEGVPYYLPTALIEVSIQSTKDSKGKHKELAVGTQANMIPDPAAGCILNADRTWFSEQDHTFRTNNGMLTMVSTEDVSKIEEIITTLGSAVANVFAFGASGGIQSVRAADEPTEEEVRELYESIAPGAHSFSFTPLEGETLEVPGTANRLLVSTTLSNYDGTPVQNGTTAIPPNDAAYKGIYTRVLKPIKVEIDLSVRLKSVFERRVQSQVEEQRSKQKSLGKLKNTLEGLKAKVAEAENILNDPNSTAADRSKSEAALKADRPRVDATQKLISTTLESLANLEESIRINREFANEVGDALYTLNKQVATILVPDQEVLVKVPVERARLGTTKNTMTLADGILTEYKTEYPSSALEIVKVPFDLSEKLLELPTKILQLKVDYANREKEMVAIEKDLKDLRAALNPAAPTPQEQLQQQLQREAEALRIQKEIAELRAAIEDLENGDGST